MTQHLHRALLERIDNGPGVRPTFCIRPGRRRGRFKWFDPADVPAFDGARAYVEVDLLKGKWVIVRLVS